MIQLDVSKQNIVIEQEGDYQIIGKTTEYNIYINCKASIELNEIDIDVQKKSTGAIILGTKADVIISFLSNNTIRSADNYGGIDINGKSVLLLKGDKNSYLNIYSGTSAAGIGGGYGKDLEGEVTIDSGNINIISTREGAGIGGGNGTNGGGHLSGKLTINGGIINITPGDYGGAAIGGGCCGDLSGNVYINGGVINCISGKYSIGSGIGGGYDANLSGNVLINGGEILASGGEGGAGIGSGIKVKNGGDLSGNVIIKGGKVNAIGGAYIGEYGGAGIGSGYGGNLSGNILLVAGEITAKGSGSAYDIGSGSNGEITGDVGIKVKEIEVTPTSLFLNIAQSKKISTNVILNPTIHADISNYQKIDYESENINIAIVDEDGVVTGLGEGKTKVIVTSLFDKTKSATCDIEVNGKNIIIGKIDLLIDVEKDEIDPVDLDRIVCYGNNPRIKKLYTNSSIDEINFKLTPPECEDVINVIAKYKHMYIYLYLNYSIALYTSSKCTEDLTIYALQPDCISCNIDFCLNIDETFLIDDYKILISPTYEIDKTYSEKYYIFKIKGNIELVKVL